jgi:hypothetical protein
MSIAGGPRIRSWNTSAMACGVAFAATCGLPYLRWWAHPSLFDDDFLRVGSLRRSTLGEALFRPFNEHMAPLFEVVTWLAWVGAGRRVLAIPLAFQVASYLAFGTTLALLASWIWREVRSTAATLLAVALFSLSAVSAETVLWYSASSFQWAASASLAACLAAAKAADAPTTRGRLGWSVASALAAVAGPAFSAIGILAGPLAAVRFASSVDRPLSIARRLAWSTLPLAGTAGYLLVCEHFQYRDLVSASVRRSFDPLAASWASIRAPAVVLLPGLVGLRETSATIPGAVQAGASAIALVLAVAWAFRSRQRPLILVGLAFIAGGYLSTYATRARPGDPWIFAIQRYHLFPMIGLVGLIAGATAPWLGRFDRGPARGFLAGACLAGLLALVQYPAMRATSDRAFRYPDQPRALAAAMRLEETCRRDGITLPQAMMALEPIRPDWYPRPWPFNPLLHLLPTGPTSSRVADPLVRTTLIRELSREDLESLFGCMEATRYGIPEAAWAGLNRPVEARRIEPGQGGGRTRGATNHVDYLVDPGADDARALSLHGFASGKTLEVWWAGEADDWSPYRSVRWEAGRDLAVAFEMIPHWRRGKVRRVRVVLRDAGPITRGVVRFWK